MRTSRPSARNDAHPHPSGAEGAPVGGAHSRRGMTLIELTVSLAIIAVLFGAVVAGIGAITGAKAKGAAGELGGVIRSLYDTASLSGKTCRLVFALPAEKDDQTPVKYWAECAKGNVTTSRDRDAQLKEDTRAAEEEARNRKGGQPPPVRRYSDDEPSLSDLMAQEKDRVEAQATFSNFTSEEIKPRTFPKAVHLSVWTQHQREPVKSGLAYLYFFPQGFTEKSMLFLRQGDNVWTLTVAPLTGKTTVVGEELEVPRS